MSANPWTSVPEQAPAQSEIETLRELLSPEYADLSDAEIESLIRSAFAGLSPAELENFLNSLKNVNWGNVLGGALSGAATGAGVGTTVAPGWGTLIGGIGGALAGGIGNAVAGPQPPSAPPPPPRPVAPGSPVSTPMPVPVAIAPPSVGSPTAAGPAGSLAPVAAALLSALQNPAVLNALASAIMGAAGKPQLHLAGRTVPRAAVFEMIQVFSELCAQESARIDGPAEGWTEGRVADPSNAESRARATLELIRAHAAAPRYEIASSAATAHAWTPAEGAPAVHASRAAPDDGELSPLRLPEEAAERIVRKLNNDLAALGRFRTGIADTSVFPYSAICQLDISIGRSGRGIGTGFYIGPNVILTAAHNVNHPSYGRARTITVRPGRNRRSEPFRASRVDPSQWTEHPSWSRNMHVADFDLAVLRVDQQAPNNHWFGLAELRFNPASGVVVCGYAADTSQGLDPDIQHADFDSIRNLTAESFDYSLHTTGGSSGSPVFHIDGRRVVAIGVHSRGNDDTTNRGCRLTDAKVRWIESAARGEAYVEEESALFAGASAGGGLAFLENAGGSSGLAFLENAGAFEYSGATNGRR